MSSVMLFEWEILASGLFRGGDRGFPPRLHDDDCRRQSPAKVDSAIYEADPAMRPRMHDALNDRFLGVQLLTHRTYELSRSNDDPGESRWSQGHLHRT